MDNQELFAQVIAAMQEQTEVLTQLIDSKIRESETRVKIFIENEVGKRIDSLYDGYKLTHEKQWELEHRTEQLQSQISDLQARLAALENKIA